MIDAHGLSIGVGSGGMDPLWTLLPVQDGSIVERTND